ncbi:uncharacterized protein LOC117808543 [Tachysurus ichikawai]
MGSDGGISLVESLAISGNAVPDSFEQEKEVGGLPIVPHLSEAELRDKQRADHFTKYAVAIPTLNQKARTVAKCLWDNFITHYGIPEKLHSDQGPDFEIRTTPYHPRGNPVERFNRTLLDMLGTLENPDKSHWRDFVKPLVHAYNCTRSEVTGFTPYELMFGRQPRLPVDLAFGLPVKEEQQKSHSQYVKHLKSRLEESYKIATRSAAKVAKKNKARFDKRVTPSALDVGDRVLVRNVRIRGKRKLADKWESTVHVVVRKAGDLPVYTVKPETGEGPWCTLHRDLLLPCGFLHVTPEAQPKPFERLKTRQNIHSDPREVDQSSDEDDITPVTWSHKEPVSEVTRQRSYLGVTCHWIDNTSLERHSAALACRPVKGSHTFDVLAAALEEIHSEYQIREKVTRTTTDSGSNFLKAFRLYGEEEATNVQEDSDSTLDDATEDQSESEVEYQDVSAILDDNTGLEYQLPRHQKCECHLLNLISTVDATAAGGAANETYKRLSRSAFAKCHALSNKTSRSTMRHETVEREQAIRNVCTALKVKMFNPVEMGFLAEYAAEMKPVAMALNVRQGESSVHMGLLLPTLYQLRDKLKRLESTCKMCTPLVHALQQGIQKRFGDVMKEPELIAAAILLPSFRTFWTTEENILNAGLDYIRNHLDTDLDDVTSTNSSLSDEDDFFPSMELGKSQVGELERYLSCPSPAGIDLLHTFPHIKNLSLKVNTGLPASAACERLFSHAGLLFTANRSQLHSKNLENQLLLMFNSDITE